MFQFQKHQYTDSGWIKISEKEFRVGQNQIYIIDDSIIYIEAVGEQTDEMAAVIRQNYKQVFSRITGKVKQLINLNSSGKSSPASRRLFREMNNTVEVDKVAIYGLHPVARVLASFVMDSNNQKHIRFFRDKEKALEWLRKKDTRKGQHLSTLPQAF
jgi:hypothetical protein